MTEVASIGAPAALCVAAFVVAYRSTRSAWRIAAIVVAVASALAVVATTLLVVTSNQLDDVALGDSCGPTIAACHDLVTNTFGGTQPRLPTIERGDGYHFARGEETSRIVTLWYEADGAARDEAVLVYAIKQRQPDGYEPPTDPAGYLRTPGGTSYLERSTEKGVTALDFWDDAFHYVVSLQGPHASTSEQYLRAVALIDSASNR